MVEIHPCIFCAASASKTAFVHAKVKSWVLSPNSQYSMCDSCFSFNSNGDDKGLIEAIISKWNKIKDARFQTKMAEKRARLAQVEKHDV